jgi:hypothetical protein
MADTYYNEPVKWLPIVESQLLLDQIKLVQEEMTRRMMMPLIPPHAGSYSVSYAPIPVLGTLRVVEMTAAPIKFLGINFSVDEEPVHIERPDAAWNF